MLENRHYNLRKRSTPHPMLRLLFVLLPLGLDTLGVSISLGIKSTRSDVTGRDGMFPLWLRSALLFSVAEMPMPLVGLAIGYAASLAISDIMRSLGPVVSLVFGVW